MTTELYFSTDIESDGPIPGTYSMSSIGMCVPGYLTTGGQLVRIAPEDQTTYYAELKPITDKFDPEAAAVSGLIRQGLIDHGESAKAAMALMNVWIDRTCRELSEELDGDNVRPIFAAYPLGFDWMFTYWYQMSFTGRSPFGHSTHIDMKTLFATKGARGIVGATKRNMPKHLLGNGPHTHNALDDAREQGDMLMNLLAWEGHLR